MGSARAASVAAGGIVLLAAGFGIGMLFRPLPPPDIVRVVEVPAPVAAPAALPGEAPAAAAPPETGRTGEDSPAPASSMLTEDDRAALAALLERVPVPAIPAGSGAITGAVKTEEGAPLEDVDLSCTPEFPRDGTRPPPRAGELPPAPDPVDSAVASARYGKWARDARRVARSDAAGAFRFEGLGDGRHRIEARRRGWQIRAKDHMKAYQARAGDVVEFLAAPSVEVRVEVTWPGAAPPEGIQIRFVSGSGQTGYGINPEHPLIHVKPGTYGAFAVAGQGEELKSEEQSVEIPAEGDPPVLRFVLQGKPGIRGRVIFPEGEETPNAQVYLRRLSPGQNADPALLQGSDQGLQMRHRGRSGEYAFPDLPPGRYALGAARSHGQPAAVAEEVEVAGDLVERDLRMPPLDPTEYVVLHVIGPDGTPARDVQVGTGFRSKTMSSSGGSTVVSRPDGSRWVLHHPQGRADAPEATWWIEVTSARFGVRRADYLRGAQQEVTVRFDAPGELHVALEGYRGHSHEGRLRVDLLRIEGNHSRSVAGGSSRSGALGTDGTQDFLQLQPGEYRVRLQATAGRVPFTVAQVAVAVRSGRNEANLKVPVLHAVTIHGAEGWVMVRTRGEDPLSMQAQAGPDGRTFLDGLPAGEYEVRSGSKTATLTLPGTTEVRL